MPLTPELESLLAVAPADKREGLRKELESGYLRQSDYSRKMNELTETDKTRGAAYASGLKWVEDNRTNYSSAVTRLNDAEAKVKELEGLPPKALPTTPAEINLNMSDEAAVAQAIKDARADAAQARVDASALATKVARIDKLLADGQLLTVDQFEVEAGKRLESYSRATMDVMGALAKGKAEFGLDIDRDAFLNEAAKMGGDLGKAYEIVTAPARLEKMKVEIRNDVTKELEAKYANTNGNPLASGSPPLMGPLQQRVYQTQNPENTIDAAIPADGSGRLAHAIAAELRAEGKF